MARFQFPNAVSPHTRYDSQLSLRPRGTVHYIERWSASLSSHFYLERFPFDSQILRLSIQPFLANAEREILIASPEMTGIDADASEALVQWRVGEIGIASRTVQVDNRGRRISQLDFQHRDQPQARILCLEGFSAALANGMLVVDGLWVDPTDLASRLLSRSLPF